MEPRRQLLTLFERLKKENPKVPQRPGKRRTKSLTQWGWNSTCSSGLWLWLQSHRQWLFHEIISQTLSANCSLDNKKPKDWYWSPTWRSEKQINQIMRKLIPLQNLQTERFPVLHSSLELRLKTCTITVLPLWLTSVALGIKSMCDTCRDYIFN